MLTRLPIAERSGQAQARRLSFKSVPTPVRIPMRPPATSPDANQPLTVRQAEQFRTAIQELQAGRRERALELAQRLVGNAALAADAQQLLAMCASECGLAEVAEAAFGRALTLAPGSPVISLNYATWLRRRARLREAVLVLARASETAPVRIQQGLFSLELRKFPDAVQALRRAVVLQPDSVLAWHGLGNALRALDDLPSAEAAFREAIRLAPEYLPARVNLGAVQRLQGHLDEAMSTLRQAAELSPPAPDLQDAINGLLADLGRADEALAGARRLSRSHPEFPQGHETLANLLWEHGEWLSPGEDPLASFANAVRLHPAHRPLRDRYVHLLLAAKRASDALPLIEEALRSERDDPLLLWQAATAFDELAVTEQAAKLYARAHRLFGDANTDFLNAYARHAFKARRFERAQACANAALARDPDNQEAWAHLGTAWRLAGDSREHWLCDYEHLVGLVAVTPPAQFRSLDEFLLAIAHELDALHSASREPVRQSLRHGSQTSGRLFGRPSPVLAAAQAALTAAIDRWLDGLPEDLQHPFLARKKRSVRMVGSWSVKLRSSGWHSNHIHPLGWMSSAFYVSLPGSIGEESGDQAGWIQFGQPLEDLGLELEPRKMVQPRPGHVALFPSYFWHGTVPFRDSEPRLTVAFDMQPI